MCVARQQNILFLGIFCPIKRKTNYSGTDGVTVREKCENYAANPKKFVMNEHMLFWTASKDFDAYADVLLEENKFVPNSN
jgi:hypothetical protein